jgi:acetyltransferase-like isoleucine patch superfamily enzyme
MASSRPRHRAAGRSSGKGDVGTTSPAGQVSPGQAVIHEGVELGDGAQIDPFVVLGAPAADEITGAERLHIGRNARIRSHSVIYDGCRIGDDLQTGHGVLIREGTVIGNEVSIGSHSVVEHHVTIGDHVRIHSNAFIPEFSTLEDGSWVGPNAVFTNARYPLHPTAKQHLAGPHLRPSAKIGANATLLPGVVIGRNALVGAGSVVTRDVADDTIVAGNPARVIGSVNSIPGYAPGPVSPNKRRLRGHPAGRP